MTTTFQTADTPPAIEAFYGRTLPQQGFTPETAITDDQQRYLSFLRVVERFPFASLVVVESQQVTSIRIRMHALDTQRTRVEVVTEEFVTYPQRPDDFPPLNP